MRYTFSYVTIGSRKSFKFQKKLLYDSINGRALIFTGINRYKLEHLSYYILYGCVFNVEKQNNSIHVCDKNVHVCAQQIHL